MASRDYTNTNSKTNAIKNEYSDIDIMFTKAIRFQVISLQKKIQMR